jgi:hypothetical protein
MRRAGLLALPLVAGLAAGALADPGTGLAVAIGGLLATIACLIVLTPGRGGDIAAGGAVSDAVSGWAEFHRELARARRFDRSFAIVRLAAGDGHSQDELTMLRDGVAASARRTDRAWVDGDDVLVLLPETVPSTAAQFVERVVGALPAAMVRATVATFPDDGITSGALISVAYGGAAVVPTPIAAVRPDPRTAPVETETGPEPEILSRGG